MLFCIVMWGIWSYRIVVDNGTLTYCTMFGKQSIALDDVARARTEIGASGPFAPMFRLVIEPLNAAGSRSMIINMKIFKREDVVMLCEILGSKMVERPRLSIFRGKGLR